LRKHVLHYNETDIENVFKQLKRKDKEPITNFYQRCIEHNRQSMLKSIVKQDVFTLKRHVPDKTKTFYNTSAPLVYDVSNLSDFTATSRLLARGSHKITSLGNNLLPGEPKPTAKTIIENMKTLRNEKPLGYRAHGWHNYCCLQNTGKPDHIRTRATVVEGIEGIPQDNRMMLPSDSRYT